jgi:very-short-patch-repair endonuclease
MNLYVIALVILVALFALMAFVITKDKPEQRTPSYRRRKLLTDNEAEFFGRLVNALPEHFIFPQVSMTALLESAASDSKQAHSDRLRIAQQRIDYVVCDARCDVVAVVELDDRTHSRAKDQVRDGRLAQAGIKTVRFQSRSKPNVEAIRKAILPDVVNPCAAIERGERPSEAEQDLRDEKIPPHQQHHAAPVNSN